MALRDEISRHALIRMKAYAEIWHKGYPTSRLYTKRGYASSTFIVRCFQELSFKIQEKTQYKNTQYKHLHWIPFVSTGCKWVPINSEYRKF